MKKDNFLEEREQLHVSKSEKTFQYDESLPDLPVPSLDQTLKKYLDSVKALVSEEEYLQTEQIVDKFKRGIGPQLQQNLLERAKTRRNWLEEWWLQVAYLSQRSPITPMSNMAGAIIYTDPLWKNHVKHDNSPTELGALWIYFSLQYWKLLREEKIKPQKNSKQKRLSMNQWKTLFNCSRIPGEAVDHLSSCFKSESDGASGPTNIIVLRKGHIFTLDAFDDVGEPLTPPELVSQLEYIKSYCDETPYGPCLGALTCDNRTSWYKNREWLKAIHPNNSKILSIIESALMVLVLDEQSPDNDKQLFFECIGGDVRNRWADKSLTYIIHENGSVTSNGDHTPADAMVLIGLSHFCLLSYMDCKGQWKGSTEIRSFPKPQRLEFVLDNLIHEAVPRAIQTVQQLTSNVDTEKLEFVAFGKDFMKKYRFHPDTYVQLAIQLAYYRLYNRPAPTYETATTRQFYHGRTETVRSCTTEALTWAKAMLNRNYSKQDKLKLMLAAADKHNSLMDDCTQAHGCDRHLLGLQLIAQEQGIPTPEIFTDPSWVKSGGNGNFILSTSLSGYTSLIGGVTAMCEDGYGIFYTIQDLSMLFLISAWKSSKVTNIKAMQMSLMKSLHDMQYILVTANL